MSAPSNKPPARDPARPEFWDQRFRTGVTPWDYGGLPPRFAQYVRETRFTGPVLVPGCGAGYEVAALAEAGADVLGIDFSDAAVAAAHAALGAHAKHIRQADFFNFTVPEGGYRYVYERAFLCALPRPLWRNYGERMADIIAVNGVLFGYFFFDDNHRGPPFGLHDSELESLLGGAFEQIVDEPTEDKLAVFNGKVRWQQWRRR